MDRNELFFELLHHIREQVQSEEFLEEFRVPNHFVRKGRISMENMVTFLLFHSKLPLDGKLDALRDKLPECDFPKVSKQALSKARYGIRFELFRTLFDNSVSFYYGNTVNRTLWQGKYHIFAIDGSDQEVPSSESTFAEFGKQSDQKNPTLFWSMALASVLYDVLEDMVVDAVIEKQATSERELAVKHLSRLVDLGLQDNSILVFDRGYFSADIFQECINSGCMCLMRLRKNSLLGKLESNDEETFVTAPDGTQMRCRVLKVILNTGEVELLITNVFDKDISAEIFGDLYFERWKIETKYLEIKERWLIEEFTGTGTLAVRQDFYITMLYSNLSAIIKQEADKIIEKTANALNVYQYRARRTYIIGKIQRTFIKWLQTSFTLKDIDDLMLDASKKRSQIQPGRTRKRKRRTRARKHYNNRKSAF